MEGGYQLKVDRLVSIIMILLDKERIGAQELADMFEVSPRIIYRDIDTINMAGIPVRGASGVGGGFEIMQKYKIYRKVFSTADLYFTPRDYQKPQLDFTDILATMQTKIKIRIHKSVMDRVLDYCTYENFSPDGDEYCIVSFPFIEN